MIFARPYIFALCALAYIPALAACGTTTVISNPCLLPSDQAGKEEVAPLPEQDADLVTALKLWNEEHKEHVKLAERKNDVVKFVQEHCQ